MNKVSSPKCLTFFTIEEVGGQKQIHIFGSSEKIDKNRWVLTEYTFLIQPIKEFVENVKRNENYVELLAEEIKQYAEDFTPKQMTEVINGYFGDAYVNVIDFDEITTETPCGCYVC